ncbi:MAG TPA: diaminopimelate decarboxylase [Chloroflexota bacterium]|nr:diaminopimelate decarboxylase [Chloroflexota bacterium]
MLSALRSVLPDTACFDRGLAIGGCDVSELAARYGTPLYLYCAATLRRSARDALAAFGPLGVRVSFAAKACALPGVMRIFADEGLGLDAVSAGEMEAGLRAAFPPDRIHLHGNVKSDQELEQAVRLGLHAVVLDNREEIVRLASIVARESVTVRVTLRLNLPLEARTHPHLQTTGARSKFGIPVGSEDEVAVGATLRAAPRLCLTGLHTHLGSQISDAELYETTVEEMRRQGVRYRDGGFPIEEITVGGGWAEAYAPGDERLPMGRVAAVIGAAIPGADFRWGVEPGRALVARAGIAVYRVGAVKRISGRRLVAVDGGMGDNPRPALYGARYTGFIVGKEDAAPEGPATVVGRYCESGDILVHDVALPAVQAGDLLAVPMSGAYQLSMASAYNLVPPPAAVLVDAGRAQLIRRRLTTQEILAADLLGNDAGPAG